MFNFHNKPLQFCLGFDFQWQGIPHMERDDDWPNVVLHLGIWKFCLLLLLVVRELSVFLKICDITCGATTLHF